MTLSEREGTAKPKGRQSVADAQASARAKIAAIAAEVLAAAKEVNAPGVEELAAFARPHSRR